MGLPPATPAPSRFLISKRSSTQKPQSQTPNAQYVRGPNQFHATPRFSATPRPSSTQPGPSFATPALAIKSRAPRTRSTQDIIDESSPISHDEGSPSASPTARDDLPEPIEFDSSLVPQSPSPSELKEERSPKRRRISIASSEPETDAPAHSQHSEESDLGPLPDAPDHIISYHSDVDGSDDDLADDHDVNVSPTHSISSTPTRHPFPRPEADDEPSGSDAEQPSSDFDAEAPPETPQKPTYHHHHNPNLHQPLKHVFLTAPRFKTTEPPGHTGFPYPPDTTAYLAADIFSPQRRGTKYLPGGLAAELRDWLVDVKGGVDGEGEVTATSSMLGFNHTFASAGVVGGVRVSVEEVSRGGVGMTLVSGRLMGGDSGEEEGGQLGGGRVRVILAGEGNIDGLGGGGKGGGNRGRVGPGAVVAVVPPAWNVELDGPWAVAYRWEVVKGVGGDDG